MLERAGLCETRFPLLTAIAAVMRAVVVSPLLPVMTIFLAGLAPTTDLSTLGSMRRAIKPGKLVPPPMPSRRPDAPASFPAEIASARRALSRPDGVTGLLCVSSFIIIPHCFCCVQYSKRLHLGLAC